MKRQFIGYVVVALVFVMAAFTPVMGMGWTGGHDGWHDGGGGSNVHDTPDPSSLVMLLTGAAGVGSYYMLKRRNRRR